MITKIIFSSVVSVTCPEPVIEVIEPLTWAEEDDMIVEKATQGCIRNYGKNSCLVRIDKSGS
jgi:hypothetical protein